MATALLLAQNAGLLLKGHTRLAIIDLDVRATQPMQSNDNRLVISFNGEIYNYKQLKKQIADRYQFKTESDTEVILAGITLYGTKFLNRLRGIFAIAIWDKHAKELILIRDDFGIKPLYYTVVDNTIIAASEISTILLHPKLTTEINNQSLVEQLGFLWVSGEKTLINNIYKLKPGHLIKFKNGKVEQQTYVDKQRQPQLDTAATNIKTSSDLIKNLDELLQTVVTEQLVADVAVGCFLSGGIDSTLICHYAKKTAKQSAKPIEAFCIDTGSSTDKSFKSNDGVYAQKVADKLDIKLNKLQVSNEELELAILDMSTDFDIPITDPAVINTYLISKLAKAKGIKVMLSGAGADDIFSGYRRHLAANWHSTYNLPTAIRIILKKLNYLVPNGETFRRVKKLVELLSLDRDRMLLNSFLWEDKQQLSKVITNANIDIALEASGFSKSLEQAKFWHPKSLVRQMLYLEQRHFLTDHNLQYTDAAGMRAGIEIRVPFLDARIVEFSSQLPNDCLIRANKAKWLLKQLVAEKFGDKIAWRSKTGFGLPLNQILRGPLQSFVTDVFNSEQFKNRDFVNQASVMLWWQKFITGKVANGYSLFAILNIELWLRANQS